MQRDPDAPGDAAANEAGAELKEVFIIGDPATRRVFLKQVAGTSAAVTLAPYCSMMPTADAVESGADAQTADAVEVRLKVNGHEFTLRLDPRVTLLDALRERLGLTGSKKGCDHGQCGACTVLVNGRRINSCLSLAVMHDGDEITTIEGLATGEVLHPVQAAFVAHDGFQCGYCTPGQICSAVALLNEGHVANDDDIREWMSGNICRCGAYTNIVAAIREAQEKMSSHA